MSSPRTLRLSAACFALVACGTSLPVASPDRPFDLTAFMAALQQSGASVRKGEAIEQPFLTGAARLVSVDGVDVQVFEYADESAARAGAQTVSADGAKIGTSAPFWAATPHFYRKGLLIVLYTGDSAAVQARLQGVLGPQFAGGATSATSG